MLLNILKKFLIILILVFNFYINAKCGEILFPKNDIVVSKQKLHIVGKLDRREDIVVIINDRPINISRASLIKKKTNDGTFYIFKVDLTLDKGENIIKVINSELDKTILIKYQKYAEQQLSCLKTSLFHMDDNRVFCKICHNFNNIKECNTCHSDKNRGKFVHGPVATWQCFICHDKNNYFAIKQPLSAQCLKCHQEFSDAMYNAKFAHAPSVAGYCTICHLPHIAKEKYFLADNVNKLCSKCHEHKKSGFHVLKKKIKGHVDIFCTKCHNPHYGETKFLFNGKISKKKFLCKRCHKK